MSSKVKAMAGPAATISIFTLAIMNIVAVVSLRGLPSEAEYGLSSIFYYLFAAVVFLIPVSLVAAELATGWPEKGGVFRWVGEAFGPRWAFVAMFMLWTEVTVWFPTGLTFGAVSLAFTGPNQHWDRRFPPTKCSCWQSSCRSTGWPPSSRSAASGSSPRVSKWGGIAGTIIPAIILIVLGFAYLLGGGKPQIELGLEGPHSGLYQIQQCRFGRRHFPLLCRHGNERHPRQGCQQPNAQLSRSRSSSPRLCTVTIFVLGTLAIAFIIPNASINLTQSLLVAYFDMFKWAHIQWLAPVMAVALAVGVFAGIVTWVSGPSSGLLVVAKAGYMPRFWQHTNKHGMATHILLVQAMLVTVLSIMFVVLPTVQATYQILSQLTVILYLVMYLLMFAAAIYLRFSQPNRPRPYKIPGGDFGMWLVGGLGFLGSLLALILSFIPPGQIKVGSPTLYVGILIGLSVLFVAIPFVIFAIRKPHWRDPDSDFAPFTWEAEGGHPGIPTSSVTATGSVVPTVAAHTLAVTAKAS